MQDHEDQDRHLQAATAKVDLSSNTRASFSKQRWKNLVDRAAAALFLEYFFPGLPEGK